MWDLYGIEPDTLNYASMQVVEPEYPLRPEIVESTYYLYHYTRDPYYRVMGKRMFEDFVKYCRRDDGYAALSSVITKRKTMLAVSNLECFDCRASSRELSS